METERSQTSSQTEEANVGGYTWSYVPSTSLPLGLDTQGPMAAYARPNLVSCVSDRDRVISKRQGRHLAYS